MINSLFRRFILSHSRFGRLYLFFSKSSKLSQLYHLGDTSKALQGFTLCFQLPFLLVILLLPEFFMKVLHDLIHSSIVHQDSFQRSSSILHLVFRSTIRSIESQRWFIEDLPKGGAISLLIFFTRISSMPNPFACHQFNW